MNPLKYNSSRYMRPGKYRSAFVTWPYYYNYHSVPYLETKMLFEHDQVYDPYQVFVPDIVLRDGTIVEGFTAGFSKGALTCFLLLVIVFFIFQMKK